MRTGRANDLKAFRDFADAKLSYGGATLTLEEALDLWEYDNSLEKARQETLEAIRRGLEDMHAGRTVDAFEFAARMGQKLLASNKP